MLPILFLTNLPQKPRYVIVVVVVVIVVVVVDDKYSSPSDLHRALEEPSVCPCD